MIPTRRLSDFLPWVMPHAQGVPFPHALQALHDAAVEFCEGTKRWRHTALVEIAHNDAVMVAPFYTAIVEIEAATFDGVALDPVMWTDSAPAQLSGVALSGRPATISQIGPNSVALTPFMPGTLRVAVILKPAVGVSLGHDEDNPMENAFHVVPEFLYSDHVQAIAHGALSRVMMVPNKPYTNPELAAYHTQMFDRAMRRFATSGKRGQQKAPLRVPASFM